MEAVDLWEQMLNGVELWRAVLALISGFVIGMIYFKSMRWSINHLDKFKHKVRTFALTAICRIALFLGVLVLVCERNVVLILLYVIAFFITKMVIVGFHKNHLFEHKE